MFFADVEHSIRELGIGDLGVPKRMKKLARMFYGRAAAYGEAIDARRPAGVGRGLAAQHAARRTAHGRGLRALADYRWRPIAALTARPWPDLPPARCHFRAGDQPNRRR